MLSLRTETVKQWLICKQLAENRNKKCILFADEAGQVSRHAFLLLLKVSLTWNATIQLLNARDLP